MDLLAIDGHIHIKSQHCFHSTIIHARVLSSGRVHSETINLSLLDHYSLSYDVCLREALSHVNRPGCCASANIQYPNLLVVGTRCVKDFVDMLKETDAHSFTM